MKTALKVYKWIIISILCQVIVYIFINNVYLSSRTKLHSKLKVIPAATPVAGQVKPEAEKGVPVPENAKDIKVSCDRSYAAYTLDGKLEILDLQKKKSIKTIGNSFKAAPNSTSKITEDAVIAAYKWLQDKNTIIYALNSMPGAPVHVQLVTYDVDSDSEHNGVNMTSNYLPNGSEITDLSISSLNAVIYPKIKTGTSQARFYRIDIMNNITHTINVGVNASAKIGHYSETLVYQDGDNRIFRKNSANSATTQLQLQNKMVLLDIVGIESEGKDMLYTGELNESGKVQAIHKGKADSAPSQWTNIPVKTPISPKSIMIKRNGAIYGLVEEESTVYDITSNVKTSYTGQFIDVVDGNIAYLQNNMIKFKPLQEK